MTSHSALFLALMAFAASPALAQTSFDDPKVAGPAPTAEQRATESRDAERAAVEAGKQGPASIPLADQAKLDLPAGREWIPRPQAERLLRAWGNHPSDSLLGLVFGETDKQPWVAIVTSVKEGFVKDDDAKDLDPDKLLADMRESAQEGNADRAARGFAPMEVGDWLQKPKYDAQAKRLVWALPLMDVGADPSEATINYNTRALGRDGYLSLNLLTDREHFAAQKPEAEALLQRLSFVDGKRYSDFNSSTDQVAEYGLAALIGVVALKKLGIIALVGAFLLKFAKLGFVAVAGAGYAIKKWFTGRGPKNTTNA